MECLVGAVLESLKLPFWEVTSGSKLLNLNVEWSSQDEVGVRLFPEAIHFVTSLIKLVHYINRIKLSFIKLDLFDSHPKLAISKGIPVPVRVLLLNRVIATEFSLTGHK